MAVDFVDTGVVMLLKEGVDFNALLAMEVAWMILH